MTHIDLSETTHFLYAEIDEWSLACISLCPGEAADPPVSILKLSGMTDPIFADFEHPLPLKLSLLREPHTDSASLLPWRLSLIEGLDSYGIPTLLEGALPLAGKIWADLNDGLLLAAREPGYTVQVQLETREFMEKSSEFDPERNFSVISFGFELQHRKGSR